MNLKSLATVLISSVFLALAPLLPAIALTAPTSLNVVAASPEGATPNSGSAKVTWAKVTDATGYTVYASSDGLFIAGSTPTCDNAQCTSYIEELTGGVAYSVVVSAVDSDGAASSSAAVNHTAQTIPTEPVPIAASTGSETVILSWRDPSRIGGQELVGYYITSDKTDPVRVAGNQNSYTFSSLVNGQNYAFQIQAINATGTSSAALFQQAMPIGVPAAPGKPNISSGSSQVTVTWSAPASNGGSGILNYSVELYKSGVLEASTNVNVGTTTATFNALSSGAYSAKVSATNGVGAGAKSPFSNAITLGTDPVAQTITFPTIGNQNYPGTLTLNVSANSGLLVTLVASGNCTVTQQVVTFTSAGSCQIVASQAGNSSFLAASITRSFSILSADSGNNSSITPVVTGGGGGGGGAFPFLTYRSTISPVISGSARVEFQGTGLNVVTGVRIGGELARLISTSSTKVVADISGFTPGLYDLVLEFGTLKYTFTNGLKLVTADEISYSPVVSSESPSTSTSSSSTKISIGTFKGFVAIYFKGYKGTKVSIQIAGKWMVVPAVKSDYVRIVRNTGAGYTVNSKIYIDRKLVQQKTLTTK